MVSNYSPRSSSSVGFQRAAKLYSHALSGSPRKDEPLKRTEQELALFSQANSRNGNADSKIWNSHDQGTDDRSSKRESIYTVNRDGVSKLSLWQQLV